LQPQLLDWLHLGDWVAAIEFVGGLFVALYCLKAVAVLAMRRDLRLARLVVAEGALWGLSFKVAATLLKLVLINTWSQIGMLAVTLAIRTVLKQLFLWESERLERREPPQAA
jgi:uncharacterized membrane protein